MFTFLVVCDSGTQSTIKVTDRAKYYILNINEYKMKGLLGGDLVSPLLRGRESLSDRCNHQPEPIEVQGT